MRKSHRYSVFSDEKIETMIAERTKALKTGDFFAVSRVNDVLGHRGIVLEDGADGTTWRRVNDRRLNDAR